MDLEYITKLIELISDSKVDEIEIEEDGKKIRIAKSHALAPVPHQMMYSVAPQAGHYPAHTPGAAPSSPESPLAPPSKLHEVKSPIVGTFYRAPAPDAPPFVEVGSMISKGTVLCVVEAMKLMNEIEADVSGKVVQIMVENGDPIEYDQVLFLVEPA